MWEGIRYKLWKEQKALPPKLAPLSFSLQGAQADLSPSSKCCKLSELPLPSAASQRRQEDLLISGVQGLTQEQRNLGMVIWEHQMLMVSFWLLLRGHLPQSIFLRSFLSSPLGSPRSWTWRLPGHHEESGLQLCLGSNWLWLLLASVCSASSWTAVTRGRTSSWFLKSLKERGNQRAYIRAAAQGQVLHWSV